MSLGAEIEERIREIEGYVSFLEKLDAPGAELRYRNDNNESTEVISNEVLKTLKAATFVLLYNLVESSIRAAVRSIFDDLKVRGVSYDAVREELKRVCLKNIRRGALETSVREFLVASTSIAVDIVTETYEVDGLFSGNVDARKIRGIAKEYGFSSAVRRVDARDGSDLRRVKEIRNDLGHGVRTFGDVGKDVTVGDVARIQTGVIAYMRDILENVQNYVTGREYLKGAVNTGSAGSVEGAI